MRRRIAAAAVTGGLALTMFNAPAAHADLSDPARITGGTIHTDGDLVLGPDERTSFEVSFTAEDDSGITTDNAEVNLLGPNGHVLAADPSPGPVCTPTSSTTSTCRFTFTVDTGESRITNDWAGTWRLWGLAAPNDWNSDTGQGLVTRSNLDTIRIKRRSQLTMDATPEPVRAGRTLSIIGALKFADWTGGGYTGTAGHPVRLVFYPASGGSYQYLQELETFSYGLVLSTITPSGDGWWWLSYQGNESTSWVYSAADYVDVR